MEFNFDPCSNTLCYFSCPVKYLFNCEKFMAGLSLGRKHSVKISLPVIAQFDLQNSFLFLAVAVYFIFSWLVDCMKQSENFTVGRLFRYVSYIKISNPESLCNFNYVKDMLDLAINKKNLLLLHRDKRENPSQLLCEVSIMVTTL